MAPCVVRRDLQGAPTQITPAGMEFNYCNGSWSRGERDPVLGHSDGATTARSGSSTRRSGLRQIHGPGLRRPNADPTTIGCFIDWSPDGKKIVCPRGERAIDLTPSTRWKRALFQVTNTPDIDEFGGDLGDAPVTQ
jgi:hypothetical protein